MKTVTYNYIYIFLKIINKNQENNYDLLKKIKLIKCISLPSINLFPIALN